MLQCSASAILRQIEMPIVISASHSFNNSKSLSLKLKTRNTLIEDGKVGRFVGFRPCDEHAIELAVLDA